ncbi:MAG: hypothetical protein K6V36_05580 [Anaerolineae bacterium]|nr:hypothetical protein [Anaerolineae bacterium]
MIARRHSASFAYPRRVGAVRSATRVDHRSLMLLAGLLALLAFAAVLYLSQASKVAELRFRLGAAEQEAEGLWVLNLSLREEIARSQRLDTIEERVAHLGMVSATVDGPYLVCVLPHRGEPGVSAAPAEAPAKSAPAGLWGRLLSRFALAGKPASGELAAVAGRR